MARRAAEAARRAAEARAARAASTDGAVELRVHQEGIFEIHEDGRDPAGVREQAVASYVVWQKLTRAAAGDMFSRPQ